MYDLKALYEAESVQDAIRLRLEHPEAQILAGGTDVLVQMREGKRAGKELISIYGIDAMRGIPRSATPAPSAATPATASPAPTAPPRFSPGTPSSSSPGRTASAACPSRTSTWERGRWTSIPTRSRPPS